MSTIILLTPPKKPQAQGGPVGNPTPMPAYSFEVPDGLSEPEALRYIADQLED